MNIGSHWLGTMADLGVAYISEPSVQFSSVTQSCPALCDPMDCSTPGSAVHGDSPAKDTARPPPGDLPDPKLEPRFPALEAHSLPSEPQGSPSFYFSQYESCRKTVDSLQPVTL